MLGSSLRLVSLSRQSLLVALCLAPARCPQDLLFKTRRCVLAGL